MVGTGLAITRELVSLLGGRITVESTYGEGATFNVHLPVKLTSHKKESACARKKGRSSVVNDDEKHLLTTKELLELASYENVVHDFPLPDLRNR